MTLGECARVEHAAARAPHCKWKWHGGRRLFAECDGFVTAQDKRAGETGVFGPAPVKLLRFSELLCQRTVMVVARSDFTGVGGTN